MACLRVCVLAVASLLTTALVGAQQNKPLFAFAGQSNMLGYTTSGTSSDFTQYPAILDILGDLSLTEAEKEAQLEVKFLEAKEANLYPEVSSFLAHYMLQLNNRGLMKDIETPLTNAFCSLKKPGYENVASTNESPTSDCGSPFGSELMFARSLIHMGEPWNTTVF